MVKQKRGLSHPSESLDADKPVFPVNLSRQLPGENPARRLQQGMIMFDQCIHGEINQGTKIAVGFNFCNVKITIISRNCYLNLIKISRQKGGFYKIRHPHS